MVTVILISGHIVTLYSVNDVEKAMEEYIDSFSNDDFSLTENTMDFGEMLKALITPYFSKKALYFDTANFIIKVGLNDENAINLCVSVEAERHEVVPEEATTEQITFLVEERVKKYRDEVKRVFSEVKKAIFNSIDINLPCILKEV